MSIFKKVKKKLKKKAKKVEHKVEDAFHEVEGAVMSFDPVHIAEDVKKEVLGAIHSVKEEAIHEIRKATDNALDELRKEAAKLAGKFASKTAEEVLSLLVDIVKALRPSEVGIHIGPVTMGIGDVYGKVDKIAHYAKHAPKSHSEWKQFVIDMSPESLSVVASVGFAFVLSSEDLEVGIEATWKGEDIINNIDDILRKAGIQ